MVAGAARTSPVGLTNLCLLDRAGVVHAVDGEHVHPGKTILWTRCGLHDVPDGAALHNDGALTCQACRIWIDMDPNLDAPPT